MVWKIEVGEALDVLRGLPDASVDSCVTDPPYGLEFMGKNWDRGIPGVAYWTEVLRVLKPGGYLLSFGGTRTHHRLVCAIEDAGFEVRDTIMWLYGTGFPKSLDVSKAIDKAAGVESDAAKKWAGWETALKPAHEPICVARKPLDGTVAANVLKHGTGALNIDACRVGYQGEDDITPEVGQGTPGERNPGCGANLPGYKENWGAWEANQKGRWPANVLLDEEAARLLDEQSGGASRFFYCAKASRRERGEGNKHPTVKPLALMEYLCRLVTPPGATILDPFAGSGTTGVAAILGGWSFIGIEKDAAYAEVARARLRAAWAEHRKA